MSQDLIAELPHPVLDELRRHNLLQSLIRRRVVAEAVADESLDTDLVEAAMQQFCTQAGLQDDAALEAYLTTNGLQREHLNWQVELPLRIRQHCQEHFQHKAEAHFLSRKNQLDRVVYSLLRVQDPFLARELYLRLDGGEANFADLAAEFSQGPERQTKGIVGPVPLTQAHPALAERLRTSPAGQLLEPFKIAEWWLVVRLENYTPANFDEAMAQQMSSELFERWVDEQTALRIRALSDSGNVKAEA